MKKSSASSSLPAKLHLGKERSRHKANKKRSKEIAALKSIPETTDRSGATVGRFSRPIKERVNIRIDADVLNWLKSKGKGYQTRINQLLRAAMRQSKARKRA